jgi:rubrerythrin
MNLNFNADEVLAVAERIEENGARFYRRMAATFSDPDTNKMLIALASMEDEHKAIFTEMREALVKSHLIVPQEVDEIGWDYLKAWADGFIFNRTKDPMDLIKGDETIEDILKIAVDIE